MQAPMKRVTSSLGLFTPPGLGPAEEEPSRAVCEVSIAGLPNKILSSSMMEAVLQQAGLEGCVVNLQMKMGKRNGEAVVAFSNHAAAIRCMTHFQGCQWDSSGVNVTAHLITGQALTAEKISTTPPVGVLSRAVACSQAVPAFVPCSASGAEHCAAGRPAFVTACRVGSGHKLSAASGQRLKGPAFVLLQRHRRTEERPTEAPKGPAWLAQGSPLKGLATARLEGGNTLEVRHGEMVIGSETSTEVGESEGEDKELAKVSSVA